MSKPPTHLYIHPENQELLWSVMQKSPLFQTLQVQYKHIWFKTIIQSFYEKYANVVITPEILPQINRETIQYMMEALKPATPVAQQQQQQPAAPPLQNPYPQPPSYMGKAVESMQKQEVYTKAFEQRQRDFQSLHMKPTAPEVNFKEKLEDEPIRNMEELIEQHRREREQLNHFVNTPKAEMSTSSLSPSPSLHSTPTKTESINRIQISEEPSSDVLPIIQVEMREISSSTTAMPPSTTTKKRVSWEEDSSKERDQRIAELEKNNEELMKKYDELKLEIELLKTVFQNERTKQTAQTVLDEIIDRVLVA